MSTLPQNWRSASAQHTTGCFLEQAQAKGTYRECARHFARACVEQLFDSFRIRDRDRGQTREFRFRCVEESVWLDDQLFVVLDTVTDDLLVRLPFWGRQPNEPYILTPPNTSGLIKRAVEKLRIHQKLFVIALDDYCALRVHFTSCDFNLRCRDVFEDLLARYCSRCRRARLPELQIKDETIRPVPALRFR